MPAPFPGMDPFLEDPGIFPDFHDRLIIYLSEELNGALPDPYYAAIASRTWIEMTRRHIEPDINILRSTSPANGGPKTGGGGVAVAETVRTEPVVVRVPSEAFREPFLEIYTQRGGERLVTTLEVLSMANKTPGEKGRELYLQKQKELLESKVNLVEIDLLRGGAHSTAVPLDNAVRQIGAFDYHVCIHRFDQFTDYFIHPIKLAERLPDISVPLLPDDSAVKISLQKALERCYDTGKYLLRAGYRGRSTTPPLRSDQATWADRLLREHGIPKTVPGP